jgi:hypothetical protein
MQASRSSIPAAEREALELSSDASVAAGTPPAREATNEPPASAASSSSGEDDKRGFWAKIKSRFTK